MIFFNLAPFKYHEIISVKKTPIEKIDIVHLSLLDGGLFYEAHGWLKPEFKASGIEVSNLYGSCDATGSDKFLHIATWKCISEMIERWAFHSQLISGTVDYGMNVDKTTTGFAALPCWPRFAVRKMAYGEAVERWAVSNWWLEKIGSKVEFPNENGRPYGLVSLNIGSGPGCVVITFKKVEKIVSDQNKKFYCYGFAFGSNLRSATEKAIVEMLRNERVLSVARLREPRGVNDQRLLYFSTEEGFEHFKSKFQNTAGASKEIPEPIVDCAVRGEWEQFATVWRCLLPNTDYCWNDNKHFMF